MSEAKSGNDASAGKKVPAFASLKPVNDEVEARLAAGTTKLRPQDWKCGDRAWVVEAIAPFDGAEEMAKDLKAKVFATRELKFLTLGAQGKVVRTL